MDEMYDERVMQLMLLAGGDDARLAKNDGNLG